MTYLFDLPEAVTDIEVVFPEGEDDMGDKDGMEGDDSMGDKDGMKGDDSMGDKDGMNGDKGNMEMDEEDDMGDTNDENDEESSPMYVYVVSEGKVFKINRDNPADKTEVVLSRGTRPKLSADGKILYYIRGLNTLVRRDPADPNSVRVIFASPKIGEYDISEDDRKIFYVEELTRSLNVFNTENNRRRVLINNFAAPDTLSFDDDSK